MRKLIIAFLIFISFILFLLIGWETTYLVIDDGVNKFPQNQQNDAREAFDTAMVNCFDNPLSRIIWMKMRLESFNADSHEASLKSYTFFAIPGKNITVTSGGGSVCDN